MIPTRQGSSAPSRLRLGFLLVILFSVHAVQGANTPAAISRSVQIQLSPARTQDSQNTQEIKTLELGQSVEREMAGGQTQRFQINLSAGQFASVSIQQRGIDVLE